MCSVRYQRELPALKHVGTFGLFQQRREAMAAGFDDALFLNEEGLVSEGSTWNLALHDGRQLVWPQAAALRGTVWLDSTPNRQRDGNENALNHAHKGHAQKTGQA